MEIYGEIVGLIDLSSGMYGKNSLQIDNFEVFEKGKGIGSNIIDKVLKQCQKNDIYLYVNSKKSKAFWESHKFKAINDGTGTEIHRYMHDSKVQEDWSD
ncbi:GNAT family N-acetyltransferase [Paenibacillus kribbensis]|uniref:GNAT family N-acetyltransferase n=1 Tax=Paenibacillus kribbensis TaxID=172713 RepID=UPI0015B8FC6B|nr:GNAT family N-acetyltransferase [Paenibacillus kribbensis]